MEERVVMPLEEVKSSSESFSYLRDRGEVGARLGRDRARSQRDRGEIEGDGGGEDGQDETLGMAGDGGRYVDIERESVLVLMLDCIH